MSDDDDKDDHRFWWTWGRKQIHCLITLIIVLVGVVALYCIGDKTRQKITKEQKIGKDNNMSSGLCGKATRCGAALRGSTFEITLLERHLLQPLLPLPRLNGAIASLIHPSVATVPFQYINMVQRLSILTSRTGDPGASSRACRRAGVYAVRLKGIFSSTCSCTFRAEDIALSAANFS